MTWFYAEGTTQKGPVTEEAFGELIAAGVIRPDTLVWRAGMAAWLPLVRAVAPAGPSIMPPIPVVADSGVCVECGRVYQRKDMVTYAEHFVCAGCRDVFFQKVREGVAVTTAMRYAGFWIRFGAVIIDSIVLTIVNLIIQVPFSIFIGMSISSVEPEAADLGWFFLLNFILMILQMGIMIGYKTYFVGRFGATPGKMAVSVKVVRPDGAPLTYGRACGRAFAEIISGLTLSIGYLIAAFDDEKRSLHDRICDTRVIHTG